MLETGSLTAAPAGLLGTVINVYKRWRSNATQASAARQLQILETITLGPKKQLLLVRCGARQFLVGTGAESVQAIVCMEEERS